MYIPDDAPMFGSSVLEDSLLDTDPMFVSVMCVGTDTMLWGSMASSLYHRA